MRMSQGSHGQAHADRRAVDGRDDRGVELGDGEVQHPARVARHAVDLLGLEIQSGRPEPVRDVRTRAESPPLPGQHDGAHAVVAFQFVEDLQHALEDGDVEAVHRFGAVKG
jgi:hypothetical protein